MIKTSFSSREFKQDAGGAKRAAAKGPVIITDRGRPSHVLLSFEAYQKLDQHVLPAFAGRVLPVDTRVAQRCAALHVPDPRSERDALIAATAMVHDMTVVSRNVSDFQATGVALLNPWDAAPLPRARRAR